MSIFTVITHEVITYFDINIIPAYIFDCCDYIRKLIYSLINSVTKVFNNIKNINSKIFGNISLRDFSISSIKNLIKDNSFFHSTNKLLLSVAEKNKLDDIKNTTNNLNSNTLSRSSTSGSKNGNKSSSSSSSQNSTSENRNSDNSNNDNSNSSNNGRNTRNST
jgi:hypothetical protein